MSLPHPLIHLICTTLVFKGRLSYLACGHWRQSLKTRKFTSCWHCQGQGQFRPRSHIIILTFIGQVRHRGPCGIILSRHSCPILEIVAHSIEKFFLLELNIRSDTRMTNLSLEWFKTATTTDWLHHFSLLVRLLVDEFDLLCPKHCLAPITTLAVLLVLDETIREKCSPAVDARL